MLNLVVRFKNNKPKIYLLLTIILLLVFSCSYKQFKSKKDLLNYINNPENGYVQVKIINGVKYSLSYRPTDLLVLQEINNKKYSNEKIDELKEEYSKHMYFNLSISLGSKELLTVVPKNRNEFGDMVTQLVFGMHDKVHLYTQLKDTINLKDFIYPRMYGMGKATTIMFVYPRNEEYFNQDNLNFTIEDLGLDTGEVKFKIVTNKLKNEPELLF